MAKKLSLISFLTILASSFGLQVAPVFARESSEIWTIPQLIAMQEDVAAETAELCAGDTFCEDELYFSHLETGGKYAALDGFSNMLILVTAINPANSTIRVVFHDEDPMMRWLPEEDRRATLDELYVSKFSNHPTLDEAHDIMRSGDSTDTHHPLFSGTTATNGAGWLTPNIEVELPITNAASLYDEPYLLHFAMEADTSNAIGVHDYSDCMTSPIYEEGMECRMVFDENGWFYFLPFWPGAEAPAMVTSVEEIPTPAADNPEPASDITITEDSPTESTPTEDGYGAASLEETTEKPVEVSSDVDPNTSVSTSITAPDTGDLTYPGFHAKKTDLPWWIAGLIIANLALLIWWFLPTRKKSPKNSKISKKGIDKKGRLR